MILMGILLAAGLIGPPTSPDSVIVTIDSARHEIRVTAGPFRLPALTAVDHHAMMTAAGAALDTPVGQFAWPVEGWFRGFRLRVLNSAGQSLGRSIAHHLIVVNFNRRQLLYAAPERLLGAGAETGDVDVPETIGVPMAPGMRLGMYAGWHNDTGQDLNNVYLQLTLLWMPKNQMPRPVSALPIYFDANLTVGGTNTFDVPPGRSTKAYEFTLPVGGHLLGIGGHLHDYGLSVRLDDAETGKVITEVAAKRDAGGLVQSVERRLFGVTGNGVRVKEGRRYRVVGVYDNPTGQLLKRSAMAHMVGLFAPDKMSKWPAIDLADQEYQRDLASLQVRAEPDGRITPALRASSSR